MRLRLAAAACALGLALACQHPTAPTPEPGPEPAPSLAVRLGCEPASCEAEAGASMRFIATVSGGAGGYEYSWRASRGTLVGPTTGRGAQRWVAPERPGAVSVSVDVADREARARPAHAGMQVLVVQPEEPGPPSGAPSLSCAYGGHDAYECRREPADGTAWAVASGTRSWTLWPGGGRVPVEGSSVGWLEAAPSGSTLRIRPTPSMRVGGCAVRAHGLSAATC